MEERIKEALDNFRKGYNCAQCVLCAYGDLLDIDEKTLFAVSEGFGSGMGGMLGTCGAVTGMYMLAGLKNSGKDLEICSTKAQTNAIVREMAKEFETKNKSLICKELKGIETKQPLRSCTGCIEDGIRIAGKVIFDM